MDCRPPGHYTSFGVTSGWAVNRPKRALGFEKLANKKCRQGWPINTGIAAGFQRHHFGFPIRAVQPVINVRGDGLFAGNELIRK